MSALSQTRYALSQIIHQHVPEDIRTLEYDWRTYPGSPDQWSRTIYINKPRQEAYDLLNTIAMAMKARLQRNVQIFMSLEPSHKAGIYGLSFMIQKYHSPKLELKPLAA